MNDKFDSTVLETLKSIGNELRTQKFILRANIRKQKELKQKERDTRSRIKNLVNKITWEFDYNKRLKKNS